MSWYKKSQAGQGVMYIMRGLPGSGKSTRARQIAQGGQIFSTDDFFTIQGKYQYDPEFISDAHFWNVTRVQEAIKQGISPIVVDNTNVQAWEMKPYAQMAVNAGYQVKVVEPDTSWAFDAAELAKRNQHGVPLNAIEDKIKAWEPNTTLDDILNSKRPEESKTASQKFASVTFSPAESEKIAQPKTLSNIATMLLRFGHSRGFFAQNSMGYDDISPDSDAKGNYTGDNFLGTINLYMHNRFFEATDPTEEKGHWQVLPPENRITPNKVRRLVEAFNADNVDIHLSEESLNFGTSRLRNIPVARIVVDRNDTQGYTDVPELNVANAAAKQLLEMLKFLGLRINGDNYTGSFSIDEYRQIRSKVNPQILEKFSLPLSTGQEAQQRLNQDLGISEEENEDFSWDIEREGEQTGPQVVDFGVDTNRLSRYLVALDNMWTWMNRSQTPNRQIFFS